MKKFKDFINENYTEDFQNMDVSEQIRVAIVDENNTIIKYTEIAKACQNEFVKKVFMEIIKEEKVHIQELTAMLHKLDYEEIEAKEQAHQELSEIV